jgi:nucleobase:cation symporter-1, NCS1 family
MGVATYAPPAQRVGEELVHRDGRHELADDSSIHNDPLNSDGLAPLPIKSRTWTTYNYAALWIGMAHSVPTYLLASALISLGMAWYQAIMTIALANIIVLLPMLLNSHPGTKYGIGYPVYARAAFGVFGAKVVELLRGSVACAWFGVQAWIGGGAIFVLAGQLLGSGWINSARLGAYPSTQWLSFAIFWLVCALIILRGAQAVRRLQNWAGPFVLVVAFVLLVWMLGRAGSFGPLLAGSGTVGWGSRFWLALFPPVLMAMISYWSALSLNMPDFTRFARSQHAQMFGQLLGLPTTMTLFPLVGLLVASASVPVYGRAIWDPIFIALQLQSPAVVGLALFTVMVATVSVNVAANVGSTVRGSLIIAVLGILIQPWNLLSNPGTFIFDWLGFYGGLLGPVAGVLIADYWVVRGTSLRLADLYKVRGAYRFSSGFNLRGLVALLIGSILADGGAYSAPGRGPFPANGILPPLYNFPLVHLSDYSWLVGLVVAFATHILLSALFPPKH